MIPFHSLRLFSLSPFNLSPKTLILPHNFFSSIVSNIKLRSPMGSSYQTSKLLFRQLFDKESPTYTYLLADASHPQKPALETFKNITENMNLPYPKMMDVAVPANMVCGLQDLSWKGKAAYTVGWLDTIRMENRVYTCN